jgi:opacity protein-like surface antigen
MQFTWQAYGGVAYSVASWADVSLGYRYLAFQNNPRTGVHHMSLSGFIAGANFRF